MSIILNKAIADWRQTDIEKLIKDKIAEGQSIEYKEKMYERNDESIREMLRDITAFANAYGGYLIIGIKEDDEDQGIPTEILGVENAEEERDRISSLCLSSIDPRIPGFEIQIVPSGKQNPIIILGSSEKTMGSE